MPNQKMLAPTLAVRPADPLTKKLPPNEFDGSYSTFKIGLGYIGGRRYLQPERGVQTANGFSRFSFWFKYRNKGFSNFGEWGT